MTSLSMPSTGKQRLWLPGPSLWGCPEWAPPVPLASRLAALLASVTAQRPVGSDYWPGPFWKTVCLLRLTQSWKGMSGSHGPSC